MDNERRVKSRYPLELKVRYQAMGSASTAAGVGHTVNMSSSGMQLTCASHIPEGTRMKVFVEWPTLLDGTTPLQLITMGTVVRRSDIGICIVFESYQFRTMSRARQFNVAQMPEQVPPPYSNAAPLSLKSSA